MPTNFRATPAQDAKWIDSAGRPTPEFYDYVRKIDAIIRTGAFGPLKSVADEAPATLDAASIPIGNFYRIVATSTVRVRIA